MATCSPLRTVSTAHAPSPAGHYSQAVVCQGLLFVSGQLPIVPGMPPHPFEDVRAEAAQVLRNIDQILIAAGSSRDRVVKTTVFISDIALWGEVNKVYAEFFVDHRPARSVVPAGKLHFGFNIEMEVVATVED